MSLNTASVYTCYRRSGMAGTIEFLSTAGSTNELMKQAARGGASAESVIITDYQSAGKGRLGRVWKAPAGTSLLLSVLFRPNWPPDRAAWLTMIAGLAICDAIETATGLDARLKWPNDVVLATDAGWAKVAGILLESSLDGDRLATVIVGMGINVNIPASAMPSGATPPTSLLVAAGEPVDRLALLDLLLTRLRARYRSAENGHSPLPAWRNRLVTLGRQVTVSGGAVALSGLAETVDEAGHLRVRDAAGQLHTVAGGDVTLRTP